MTDPNPLLAFQQIKVTANIDKVRSKPIVPTAQNTYSRPTPDQCYSPQITPSTAHRSYVRLLLSLTSPGRVIVKV